MNAKNTIIKVLTEISRFILGITFVFSGFTKAVDPYGFAYKIQDYLIAFGLEYFSSLSLAASIALCVIEFTVGVFLLLGMYRKWNTRVALLIMLFMTPLTLYLAIANPVSDCGCFGDALIISNWNTFFKNIVLLAAAIIATIYNQKITNFFTGKFYWVAALFVISYGIVFAVYNSINEPIFDFRPYKIGTNIPDQMSVEEGKGDVYQNIFIYEKDGEKKEFTETNYPWQDSSWIFVDRINKLVKEGQKPTIQDFEISRLYLNPNKTEIEDQEDITQEVLEDENYTFLMIAYSLSKMNNSYISRFADVNNYAIDNKYNFYCLTSSTEDEIIKWENDNANNFKFCLTDERTLKTIMRSNPGLMIIKDGIIINKLTGSDVPSEEQLTAPFDQLKWGQPIDTEKTNKENLIYIIALFIAPLLLINLLDALIYKRKKKRDEKKQTNTN